MSFDAIERSLTGGKPVSFYSFTCQNQGWFYCDADRDLVLGGVTYSSIAISNDGISQAGTAAQDAFTVHIDATSDLAVMLASLPPSQSVYAILRRMHYGDTEAVVAWSGTFQQIKVVNTVEAEITLNTMSASFARNGVRLTYQRTCPLVLYGPLCRANKATFSVARNLVAVDDRTVQFDGAAITDGWFTNGYIEWSNARGITERRAVMVHAGNTLTILGSSGTLQAGGAPGTMYPGCARTTSVCLSKFNNLVNYGGFPGLPGNSPFSGDPVF